VIALLTMNFITKYLEAQESDYEIAYAEIITGKKINHWMWYIFPQIIGLGHSSTAMYYAIQNKEEAHQYLLHSILGARLIEISTALLNVQHNNVIAILGETDTLKLKSCMTLFASVSISESVFALILHKYFNNEMDENTIAILQQQG
jgi:uncharacterized protein (DUF1810 family)